MQQLMGRPENLPDNPQMGTLATRSLVERDAEAEHLEEGDFGDHNATSQPERR